MRILVYNIRYATGTGPSFHLPLPGAGYLRSNRQALEDITAFIRREDPDIVGLVEVDTGSVRSGMINRQGRMRVIRDGKEVYDGIISSLRRFKEDVTEVKDGFECGIGVENFNDVKVGDLFECYRKEIVARTLESSAAGN